MSYSGSSTQFVKNQKQRTYPKSFRKLMLRKMADSYEFMAYDEIIRAFHNFYLACLYVIQDPQERVFIKDWQAAERKADPEIKDKFHALFMLYEQVYGTKPASITCRTCNEVICLNDNEDREVLCRNHAYRRGHRQFLDPLSFLELKSRDKPDPASGKVSISRRVNFLQVWGKYRHEILIHKIGYYVEDVVINKDGFPQNIKIPMFEPTEPDLEKYFTYWLPYPMWEEQHRKCVAELIAIMIQLEDMIREYLHREHTASKAGSGQQTTASAPPIDESDEEDDESDEAEDEDDIE